MITDNTAIEYVNCLSDDDKVTEAVDKFNRGDYGNAMSVVDIAYNHYGLKNNGSVVGKYAYGSTIVHVALLSFERKAIISKYERFTKHS
jgi:hypothetical protein